MDLRAKDLRAESELRISVWVRFLGIRQNSWVMIKHHEILESLLINADIDYVHDKSKLFFTWDKLIDWDHELTYTTIYELSYVFNKQFRITNDEQVKIEVSRFSPKITIGKFIKITDTTFPENLQLNYLKP